MSPLAWCASLGSWWPYQRKAASYTEGGQRSEPAGSLSGHRRIVGGGLSGCGDLIGGAGLSGCFFQKSGSIRSGIAVHSVCANCKASTRSPLIERARDIAEHRRARLSSSFRSVSEGIAGGTIGAGRWRPISGAASASGWWSCSAEASASAVVRGLRAARIDVLRSGNQNLRA